MREPLGVAVRLTGMKLTLPLVAAATSLWLGAGCGSIGAGGDVDTEPAPGSSTATGSTELTVVVKPAPNKDERTYTLVCDPAGGDHPDAEAACRTLSELDDPFAPVPPDVMCTEVYGGPQTATVTGTFRGDPVHAEFSRTDGCEIARWDKHASLLVETGGVDVG
jgi:hypothetical protein